MYADISKLLHIQYPIVQGAMAWISDASLVSAVSNAGGLGVLASGYLDGEGCRQEIQKIKSLTDKPFAVNIMMQSPCVEDIVKVVCEEKVPVATTGAGSPSRFMKMLKDAGVFVMPVIASVAMAKKMEKDGADALVAEGMEAGGHVGKTTTMALLPQVVDAVQIPVLGAGGIGDGRGMAAARMLGASGFQIGTRFLLAKECLIHQNYKNKVIQANDIDTTVTGAASGHPVRGLRNKLTRAYDDLERRNAPLGEYEILGKGALRAAVKDGDVVNGSVMAGQIAGLVHKEQTAKEIIEEMYGEYISLMRHGADMI